MVESCLYRKQTKGEFKEADQLFWRVPYFNLLYLHQTDRVCIARCRIGDERPICDQPDATDKTCIHAGRWRNEQEIRIMEEKKWSNYE